MQVSIVIPSTPIGSYVVEFIHCQPKCCSSLLVKPPGIPMRSSSPSHLCLTIYIYILQQKPEFSWKDKESTKRKSPPMSKSYADMCSDHLPPYGLKDDVSRVSSSDDTSRNGIQVPTKQKDEHKQEHYFCSIIHHEWQRYKKAMKKAIGTNQHWL